MEIQTDVHTQHISQQFNAELNEVKNRLLAMGGLVEKQVTDAIEALITADSDLAKSVREKDDLINDMELAIDEECTRILARRQPAASDLRLVVACSKAASDLERVGDEATKVARHAIDLCEQGESPRGYVETRHIGNMVRSMIKDSLTAFARFDTSMALKVAKADKSVDLEYKSAMRELVTFMMEDPRSISRVLNVIWVLRSLERIGDLARNIAEHVIYLVKGTDVRHLSYKELKRELKD
ncbi:phosphate signaling complex protein PhoU [Aestuariirhabdus sp. Z084]|uniref:phosphate signaling complex protein PhoU n=1 Tax=Aestuariirhabdus haliotis TaxID=2918751 RepID=UPI00201B3CD9|nr:phosphate signaling complex protein PhoU [Aestuariirhabdus haliotis]MCL6414329.1 phosphate signaling complex protein PhoU [Aestuariirhabdus haliotis]MCL6418261.1 phosphate signaling complex protein PhoU [Aestuariirhabdus haliotis]